MDINQKAAIAVTFLGLCVFWFARPVALVFTEESDFARRRLVWFILTIAGLLSPSFWLFALVAAPLIAWAGARDTNPVALYMLLFQVIPEVGVPIPTIGITSLFDLNMYRLLTLFVLIPSLLRRPGVHRVAGARRLDLMAVLLLGFGALQIILNLPIDSFTSSIRRAFLFLLDYFFLYYAVNRLCSKRREIIDAMASFCLASALMASEALLESAKQFLLYSDFTNRWGVGDYLSFYNYRGGYLRAVASSGNCLSLGYLLAIAFGFWLYLSRYVKSGTANAGTYLLISLGNLAAYSRGPWIGALSIFFFFNAVGRGAITKIVKAALWAGVLLSALALSPIGERVISVIPFMGGTVDIYNATYRQRVATRSWELIQENPLFGDILALSKLEDLRQGSGIIDLVNAYAVVALFNGLVGLSLFVGFILVGLFRSYRFAKHVEASDPDLAALGFALVACILGTLIMIASCSMIGGYGIMYYALAGLATAYARLRSSAIPATGIASGTYQ